ncbi:hypothetical protein GCM10025867_18980 [Frondihabitans sucicola]|uniref:Prepilin type IV endopeptidase peptidase domain-containing protein n=1 Tax=Frondihabitans sucicola TaxID=1268041 RepID=A0ABM8GN58_9MICO|nr:A24 family peptidase [Frondihabitans sucicola]BDZ49657.1 hypothetical protein GCM10025867_18980 [Frondihabitans sucicola]
MNAFVDAAVILLLLGLALGAPESGLDWLAAAPAACWVAVATPALVRSDLEHRRLPNALTLPAVGLVALSAAGSWVFGEGGRDPALALGLCLIISAVGFWASARGGVGMGDVKLAVALVGSATLVDVRSLAVVALVTGASGVAAAVVAVRRHRATSIAYGPCLLAGYWCGLVAARIAAWPGPAG